MSEAIGELNRLPLSNRLLLKTHGILMQDARRAQNTGRISSKPELDRGHQFERCSVYPSESRGGAGIDVGPWRSSGTIEEIEVPHLVRIAITIMSTTIHPFLDGNGRVGRLLITLCLVSHGLLAKPSLYLSDYFERNKGGPNPRARFP